MKQITIVGAGQGGFQAAASLRQEGFEGTITLIGDEKALPYQRPPLSKAFLKSGNEEPLFLRLADFYQKNAISLVTDCRIDRIDRAAQKVFAGQRAFSYDHLILATGCHNLRPPIAGLERAMDLRSLNDARTLRAAIADAKQCAIIGGGFIGLEFAAVARSFGHKVCVAERADRLMSRVVSPQMSQRFAAKHQELGVDIRLGQGAAAVHERGLELTDGTIIPADLVLLAAGVVASTQLAEEAGLNVNNGIVVDAQLRSSDPNISALGDCAAFPLLQHQSTDIEPQSRVRLESVQAATDHARHIAKRLVKGDESAYCAVPWFWSDQADWKLQIAGLAFSEDVCESLPDGSVLRFSGDRLCAVESVNAAKIHMKARRLLAAETRPDRAQAIKALT